MRDAFWTVQRRSKPRLEGLEVMPAERGHFDVRVNQPRSKERGNSFPRGGRAGRFTSLNGAKVGQFIATKKILRKVFPKMLHL